MSLSTDSTEDGTANEQNGREEDELPQQSQAENVSELEAVQQEKGSSTEASGWDVLTSAEDGDEDGTDECQNGGDDDGPFADQQHKEQRGGGIRRKLAKNGTELKDTKQFNIVTKLELEKRVLQAELNHQKLLTEHNSLQVKMAEMEREKQKIADQLAQQQSDQKKIIRKLMKLNEKIECTSKDSANAVEEIVAKIHELADHVNDSAELIEHMMPSKFAAVEKFVGVVKEHFHSGLLKAVHPNIRPIIAEVFSNPPENCWDGSACHSDLLIYGDKCSVVHYKAERNSNRSVFAKCSIPKNHFGIFYYEVKIENVKKNIWVGIATKGTPTDQRVGEIADSFSYENNGIFWLNNVKYEGKPTFKRDDVIGCGVNLASGRILFTKNGQRLDTTDLFICATDSMFPCVTLGDCGDLADANFGPVFKFNPSDV